MTVALYAPVQRPVLRYTARLSCVPGMGMGQQAMDII